MSETVTQGSHGNLQQTIGEDEGTLYPSPLGRREMEVVHDTRPRHTDIDAIQESHHAQDDEHDEDHVLPFHSNK